MTIQEWKSKINSYFQPKTPAERQKMMKYLVVFPAAILSGIVILWLLYSSLNKDDEKTGDAFNTEIPAGESEAIGTKVQEYEAADAAREKQRKQAVINTLDSTIPSTDSVTVAEPSAIEQSAEQYQQVQASLQDFYVPDYSSNSAEVAALQERIAELETQNTLAQQQAQPDELEQSIWEPAMALIILPVPIRRRKANGTFCLSLRLNVMWCHLSVPPRAEPLPLRLASKR